MALTGRQKFRQKAYLAVSRITRGMTLGVRAMLLREAHVVLVRHTYISGWYLPGGGVEAGESVRHALQREIAEEAGAVLTGPAELFGIYRNAHVDSRDHVAMFVCREWERRGSVSFPNREILASEAFPVDSLPPETSQGTRRRLEEVLSGGAPSPDW